MLQHYFKLAIRNAQRNKSAFSINLIGLSSALACLLFIFLWIQDELKVDKFHEHESRIFQVMHNLEMKAGTITTDISPIPLAEELANQFPEIERAVAVNDLFNWRGKDGIVSLGDNHLETKGLIAEKDFFNIFSFNLIEGNKDQVLRDKNSVVISKSLADKILDSEQSVIGQTIHWEHTGFSGDYLISGVFSNPPAASSIQFDVVFHIDQLLDNDQWSRNWTGSYGQIYFLLKENTDLQMVNEKLAGLMKEKVGEETSSVLFAQRFSDKYLHAQYENGKPVAGRMTYIRLFSLIAFFIMLIACINFMNLSTAKASLKMKEIGIKKTIGASKSNLIFQFLGESMFLVLIAFVIAIQVVVFLLPQFNTIAGKEIQLQFSPQLIFTFCSIVLLTGILAGCYPAFYLSGFKPASILKGKLNINFGELWVRKGLVVFQFSMALLFMVALFVIQQQIKLTQHKNLGYDRENIISIEWKGDLFDNWNVAKDGKNNDLYESFLMRLNEIPEVSQHSTITGNILNKMYGQSGITWSGDPSERDFLFKSPIIGYNFIETLGIELIDGRTFSKDQQDGYDKIIINEAAVALMQLDNPVGQTIGMNRGSEIIGVVKDFHYGSIHHAIEPLIFRCQQNGGTILAKIKPGMLEEGLQKIKSLHEEILPTNTFEYSFLDEDYQALYEAENRVSDLSGYFAGLAIIISCLGLFGLASFTAERRKKEIGIRKVLGSSIFGIVRMLSSDFTKTVLVAILIALPIGYWLASLWLDNFVYRITLNGWYFIVPGLLILFIAWATVSIQTIKAARINPVDCLKDA